MRQMAALLALTLGALLLAGCVYNPYTGTWAPCCGYYGYPYYRYPPPYYPYGYPPGPYMAPPQSQPGTYQNPQNQPPPGPGAANDQQRPSREDAASGMPMVARTITAIDVADMGVERGEAGHRRLQ